MNDDQETLAPAEAISVAMTDEAYERLRRLNEQYQYGNNYLLTVILENFEAIADADALDAAFRGFTEEYGAPAGKIAPKN